MDFSYFRNNFRLIAADLNKQKFITFSNNQKKQCYDFLKEQQKFTNYI